MYFIDEEDIKKINKLVYWYDRKTKNYIIQCLDINGYELTSEYIGNKKSLDYVLKEYKEEFKKPIEKYKS